MEDPTLITLLSAAISAFITAIGTVIAAYITAYVSRWKQGTESPKETILKPPGYNPRPMESQTRGFWNRRSIAVVLFALISITVVIRSMLLPADTSTTISVFSAPYPFASTGINITAGDEVKITAAGNWDCGRLSMVGPEGYDKQQYSDTVFTNAPTCALIGAIASTSPGENFDGYFMVGTQKTWVAEETGKLYLGCNDSEERFADNPTDSRLEVEIVVIR